MNAPAPKRAPVTFTVPPGTPETTCRSCNARIAWIVTSRGKKMPVNVATGESHFATCADALKWRKR
jgi:hypothetical protein